MENIKNEEKMRENKKDKRKPLSEHLPESIINRIQFDIGQASMCWERPEKAGIFDAKKAGEITFGLCHFIADVIDSQQKRSHQKTEDKLKDFEDASVIPLCVSKTGKFDEPLTEIIICTCLSGGADYVDNMPRCLTIIRKLVDGKEYKGEYTIV